MALRDVLFGRAISSEEDEGERVGSAVGIGLLGLDALASAAYGPEALLTVLIPLGRDAASYVLPLTLLMVGLLALVTASYRQTIVAYPQGGGAYTVAKENLGERFALLAAAALALDYILNVAVAVSAGVGALVSAVPALLPHTLAICLGVLALLCLINLRGVRATGLVFLLPTYVFLASMAALLGLALWAHGRGHWQALQTPAAWRLGTAPPWLLLRAFANGCTAMTGVEALSNGVPLFRAPAALRARKTLSWIVACLAALLVGIALASRFQGVTATTPGAPGYESILSQLAASTFGRGSAYYLVMGSVIVVLMFSANTSFADFPRVCRVLAGDRYLPEPFMHRGRRLAFSHGIVVLALISALLLVAFGGITDKLIPLFAIGALSAFTTSQIGMVAHWRKQGGRGARWSMLLNACGALATAAALAAVLISKLAEGAWLSLVLIFGMLLLFRSIRSHYDFISGATAAESNVALEPVRAALAIVPMRRWDAVSLKAMRLARGLADEVLAVQVLTGDRDVDDLTARWDELHARSARPVPELLVLRSVYRELYAPLLEVVQRLEQRHAGRPIVVVVGELVEPRWYHHFLHNHTASLLKALLLYRGGPQTVIVSAPFYLQAWWPERRWMKAIKAGRSP